LDLREVADIFTQQLLCPQFLPSTAETPIPLEEWFWITTILPESIELGWLRFHGGTNHTLEIGKIRVKSFGDRDGMHVIKEIPPHETVANPTVGVEATRSCHHDPDLVRVGIEETLEELLPPGVLVEFVEERHGYPGGQTVQLELIDQIRRAAENLFAVIEIVPVDVDVGVPATGRGLPHLPGTADESHLAVLREMLLQHRVIDAGTSLHADHDRMDRKMVKTILRWS
jgi:hypothetical protein